MFGMDKSIREAVESEVQRVFKNASSYQEMSDILNEFTSRYNIHLIEAGGQYFVAERGKKLAQGRLIDVLRFMLEETEKRIKAQDNNGQ